MTERPKRWKESEPRALEESPMRIPLLPNYDGIPKRENGGDETCANPDHRTPSLIVDEFRAHSSLTPKLSDRR
jgi:hypothetical protein